MARKKVVAVVESVPVVDIVPVFEQGQEIMERVMGTGGRGQLTGDKGQGTGDKGGAGCVGVLEGTEGSRGAGKVEKALGGDGVFEAGAGGGVMVVEAGVRARVSVVRAVWEWPADGVFCKQCKGQNTVARRTDGVLGRQYRLCRAAGCGARYSVDGFRVQGTGVEVCPSCHRQDVRAQRVVRGELWSECRCGKRFRCGQVEED